MAESRRQYVRCRLCGLRTWRLPESEYGNGLVKLHLVAQHRWVPRWLRSLAIARDRRGE